MRVAAMADCEGTGTDDDGGEAGTGAGGWFFVEAIVDRCTGPQPSSDEDEDDNDTGEDMVDFINDRHAGDGQEVAAEVYRQQEALDDEAIVQALKRKFLASPLSAGVCVDKELSPRLDAISIGRESQKAKRRLFELQDSGYGNTQVDTEAAGNQVPRDGTPGGLHTEQEEERQGGDGAAGIDSTPAHTGTNTVLALLNSSNRRATLLGKFKDLYGLSYMELVRQFKSNKTTCLDWVVCAFGVYCTVAEGVKTLIQQHCEYAHIQQQTCSWGVVILMLLRYKCAKNRDTVAKGLSMLLNIPETNMLIEPPKIRSTPAALYWFRASMGNASDIFGETPEWIVRQTVVGHSMEECQFQLSVMVQWAYDHDITDESILAYEYARLADVDSNAAAFLASNCQAKYVKDACTMCRHYKRAEQAQMSMSQWISFRSAKITEEGDWRTIVKYLRHQDIEFITFIIALKNFLKGIPKKSCLVFYGPADTGKSYFCMSLLRFLGGVVISYANSSSHFWLQPLADAKLGLIDDVTPNCWSYIDVYLRNALDGNQICIDRKHRPLLQLKCPPLLITTNTNPLEEERWKFLRSRLQLFTFKNAFPLNSKGDPMYPLNDANWKCFFQRLWARLDLHEQDEQEDNGDTGQPFRCVPGDVTRTV
ncbi:E1 [human papillomavirus 71]|nr:E1 [human papillomavirus 71]